MRKIVCLLVLLKCCMLVPITKAYGQQVYQPGLVDLMPQGVTTSLTDLALNSTGNQLAGVGFYGRAYLFDVSKPGAIATIWSNTTLSDFKNGARIWFGSNNRYLVLQGMQSTLPAKAKISFSKQQSTWQGSGPVAVLDAATGKQLLVINDAYFISTHNNIAFVSDKSGYKWYDLQTGSLLQTHTVSNNECAAISPNGKYIVASWDAGRKTMAALQSVHERRSETKNAVKSKKLIYIFDAANLQAPKFISTDEVDVVTHIAFDTASTFAYLQVTTTGQEQNTDINTYVFQRISLNTGVLDSSFSKKGNFYKINHSGTMACGQYTGGTIGLLKQNRIQPIAFNTDSVLAIFTTRYKLFNNSTLFAPMVLHPSLPIAYVFYEKHLFEWNYLQVRNYFKKPFNENDEAVIEAIKTELDNGFQQGSLAKSVAKQNISGSYIFDITVVGPKATVQTVFCESDEATNIPMQNALKDLIRQQNFDTEIPKNKRVKFRYTILL